MQGCLNLVQVRDQLGPWASRFDIDNPASCSSTNSELLARVEQGAPGGQVIITDKQTEGRGRRGRRWDAPPGRSLTFSLLWHFPVASDLSGLSLAVGYALVDALEQQGVRGLVLKWPNDLLAGPPPAKLGGVLIEAAASRQGYATVIGVGINLDMDITPDTPRSTPSPSGAESASPAGALPRIGLRQWAPDAPVDRETLLAACLVALGVTLENFSRNGLDAARWNRHNAYAGQDVILSDNGKILAEGVCQGVDASGRLCLLTQQGLQAVMAGDVSLRLACSSDTEIHP